MTPFPAVAELLPHGPEITLIDRVLEWDADHICARACITPAHPFFEAPHGVPTWAAVEMVAQAAAAHAGLAARRQGAGPRRGMLLVVRAQRATRPWFAADSVLDISATRGFSGADGMRVCSGEICCDGVAVVTNSLIILEEPA